MGCDMNFDNLTTKQSDPDSYRNMCQYESAIEMKRAQRTRSKFFLFNITKAYSGEQFAVNENDGQLLSMTMCAFAGGTYFRNWVSTFSGHGLSRQINFKSAIFSDRSSGISLSFMELEIHKTNFH